MNRREMLLTTAGLSASLMAGPAGLFGQTAAEKKRLGVVVYCLGIRSRWEKSRGQGDLSDPIRFLKYCHRLNAGGMQVPLGIRDETYTAKLRENAQVYGMFIEGILGLPHKEADVERFEAGVRTAKRAGADVARVVIIPGRRYERFGSADEFRQFAARGQKSLELAEPVAARHRLRLAVENHKDQRIPERLDLLKRISSEYVGACVDMGNSFALLEDPIEVVEAYAPWAFTVHLKDQAVREYADGFLFADAVLGDGFLDLPRMVDILKKAKPEIRLNLEIITRDPLKVPCLTEEYWATFADVPGRDLARTLRTVRASAAEHLVEVSKLPPEAQVQLEAQNVMRCLAYAAKHLAPKGFSVPTR